MTQTVRSDMDYIEALIEGRPRIIVVDLHKLCCEAARRGGEYRDIVTPRAAADWLMKTGELLDGVEIKEAEDG